MEPMKLIRKPATPTKLDKLEIQPFPGCGASVS